MQGFDPEAAGPDAELRALCSALLQYVLDGRPIGVSGEHTHDAFELRLRVEDERHFAAFLERWDRIETADEVADARREGGRSEPASNGATDERLHRGLQHDAHRLARLYRLIRPPDR